VYKNGVNIYLVKGKKKIMAEETGYNACGTVLHGNLKDVFGTQVTSIIVLLSHNSQGPVSWRIEEEVFCFIPTAVPPPPPKK